MRSLKKALLGCLLIASLNNAFAICNGSGCQANNFYNGCSGAWGGCYNACQPPCSNFESPCACTDPGCCENGCLDTGACCEAFGNVGGMDN